ncbi:hypothetical protein BC835DRAFT_1419276 [Cytidiella melzeri]|nr:hypothetical protein BC835DRAFT_1419276 [Cytidiella melzeri]
MRRSRSSWKTDAGRDGGDLKVGHDRAHKAIEEETKDVEHIRVLEEQARKDARHIRTLERLVEEREEVIAALKTEGTTSATGGGDPYKPGPDDYGVPDDGAERKTRQRNALASGRRWVSRTQSQLLHSESPPPRGKGKEKAVTRSLQERLTAWENAGWPSSSKPSSTARPLGERLEEPSLTTSSVGAGSLSTALAAPTIAAVRPPDGVLAANYLPERDRNGTVIPLRERALGKYRIVYEVVIDLALPFPAEAPRYGGGSNPITGYKLTMAELEAYPLGIPGLPMYAAPKPFPVIRPEIG